MATKSINKGFIKDGEYLKFIMFSKVVLWKTRELSIPEDVFKKLKEQYVTKLLFIDTHAKEQWEFSMQDIETSGRLKQEGQEPQVYFPIALAVKTKLK